MLTVMHGRARWREPVGPTVGCQVRGATPAEQRFGGDRVAASRTRPSAGAGVSEGHIVETNQRRSSRAAVRLPAGHVVAIATELAAYLRGRPEGSDTRLMVGAAAVFASRQCPSCLASSQRPGRRHRPGVRQVLVSLSTVRFGGVGSDTRLTRTKPGEESRRRDVRSAVQWVAIPFVGENRTGEELRWARQRGSGPS